MTLPTNVLAKYLARFDELIAEGKGVHDDMRSSKYELGNVIRRGSPAVIETHDIDWPRFAEWRTKCKSLLLIVIPRDSAHRLRAEDFDSLSNKKDRLEFGIAFMKGIKDDLEQGFLDSLELKIEAELASDYMGQAEQLLQEGQTGKFDHVPAAVLAGAVLEKSLRAMCDRQVPPVSTTGSKGRSLMLNGLIDGLKKAGQFNEMAAKQLRAWADIRNQAAHGEFDQFKRSDVEVMLKGVTAFLAEHMR